MLWDVVLEWDLTQLWEERPEGSRWGYWRQRGVINHSTKKPSTLSWVIQVGPG